MLAIGMGIAVDLGTDGHAPLLARAERRLYHAKHAGKNQMVLQP